jgi:hypothetical protein
VAGWLPEFACKHDFGDLEGSRADAGGRWARGAKEGLREDGREWFERFQRGWNPNAREANLKHEATFGVHHRRIDCQWRVMQSQLRCVQRSWSNGLAAR